MSVEAISSLSSLSTNASSTTSSAEQQDALTLNFETYLKILVVQLQNQDPTDATDPNQFTQELIQMQQVQAQITNNEKLEGLTEAYTASALATGVGYIGNYVRAETEDGLFSLQDGGAEFAYTLDGSALSTVISIADSDGNVVANILGGTSAGDNYVSWDGTTTDGGTAEDGTYTFTVTAIDSSGDTLDVSNSSALFKVTSVASSDDGGLYLLSGDLSLLSSDVTGVYTSATRPAATIGNIISSSSS